VQAPSVVVCTSEGLISDPLRQREVLELMRNDSFHRFRAHVLFENFRRANFNKFVVKKLAGSRKGLGEGAQSAVPGEITASSPTSSSLQAA
jgi:hypothetical protein